jgi:hypothetical protein
MQSRRWLSVVLAGGLWACSSGTTPAASSTSGASSSTGATSGSTGSSTGSTGSTGDHVTSAARCHAIASALCRHDTTCGWYDAAESSRCEAAADCDDADLTALSDSEQAAGKYRTSQAELDACVADIGAAVCTLHASEARANSAHCQDIVTGTVAVGGPCLVGGDCVANAHCLRQQSTCGGTCTADLTTGPCGPGYAAVAVGYFCQDNSTVAPKAASGQACTADKGCLPGLVCEASGVCGVQGTAPVDAACLIDHDCAPGEACLFARPDGGLGACAARGGTNASCAVPFPDGGKAEFADGGFRPTSRLCKGELFCNPTTVTCQESSVLGEACGTDGGVPKCLVGACNGGTCARLAEGAPCTSASDCASGVCFGFTSGAPSVCGHGCP